MSLPDAGLQGHVPRLRSSAPITATCTTRCSSRRWRWSTSASRPTPSRPGGSRTPTGWSAHNGEINTVRGNVNWMAARQACVSSPLFGDDISKLWPISYRGPVGHRLLRQRARVPDPRRLLAAARGDDADSRGLGGQPAHGRGAARLLRVPRRADGAVGRPGGDGLLRRRLYRRDARPERPPSGALHGHRRRRGDHGVGGRRAAGRGEEDRQEVAAPARQDAAHRPRGRAASSPTTRSRRSSRRKYPYRSWLARTQIVLEDLPAGAARAPKRARSACSIASRPSATPRKT